MLLILLGTSLHFLSGLPCHSWSLSSCGSSSVSSWNIALYPKWVSRYLGEPPFPSTACLLRRGSVPHVLVLLHFYPYALLSLRDWAFLALDLAEASCWGKGLITRSCLLRCFCSLAPINQQCIPFQRTSQVPNTTTQDTAGPIITNPALSATLLGEEEAIEAQRTPQTKNRFRAGCPNKPRGSRNLDSLGSTRWFWPSLWLLRSRRSHLKARIICYGCVGALGANINNRGE